MLFCVLIITKTIQACTKLSTNDQDYANKTEQKHNNQMAITKDNHYFTTGLRNKPL